MSGAGRKSGYRKSVTNGFLNELPLPEEGRSVVAQVGAPRGSNVFEVLLPDGSQSLALMPNKFKKLIWVKRNDFVIVSTTASAPQVDEVGNTRSVFAVPEKEEEEEKEKEKEKEEEEEQQQHQQQQQGKIQHQIEFILGKDQIRNIKDHNLWPCLFVTSVGGGDREDHDPFSGARGMDMGMLPPVDRDGNGEGADEDEEGEEEELELYDKMGNTIAKGTPEWHAALQALLAEDDD